MNTWDREPKRTYYILTIPGGEANEKSNWSIEWDEKGEGYLLLEEKSYIACNHESKSWQEFATLEEKAIPHPIHTSSTHSSIKSISFGKIMFFTLTLWYLSHKTKRHKNTYTRERNRQQ